MLACGSAVCSALVHRLVSTAHRRCFSNACIFDFCGQWVHFHSSIGNVTKHSSKNSTRLFTSTFLFCIHFHKRARLLFLSFTNEEETKPYVFNDTFSFSVMIEQSRRSGGHLADLSDRFQITPDLIKSAERSSFIHDVLHLEGTVGTLELYQILTQKATSKKDQQASRK